MHSQKSNVETNIGWATEMLQAQLAVNQMCYRHLFSEYLKLISMMLKMPQSCDSLKLLNEVLLSAPDW